MQGIAKKAKEARTWGIFGLALPLFSAIFKFGGILGIVAAIVFMVIMAAVLFVLVDNLSEDASSRVSQAGISLGL